MQSGKLDFDRISGHSRSKQQTMFHMKKGKQQLKYLNNNNKKKWLKGICWQ